MAVCFSTVGYLCTVQYIHIPAIVHIYGINMYRKAVFRIRINMDLHKDMPPGSGR